MKLLDRLFIVTVALVPALAPTTLDAKPRGCFTKSEQTAEEVVRYGLRLREGAMGCDGAPWEAHTQPLWEAVDKQFGPQFKQQTDARAKAFVREFENDAEHKLTQWNARIVFYYRNYPLSPVYCDSIKKEMMQMQAKGWNAFVKLAKLAREDIRMTYQPCDK